MSKSYQNRQTLIISLICFVAILAALFYTRPKFLSQKSAWGNMNVVPKINNYDEVELNKISDSDWQKNFLVLASTTNSELQSNKALETKESLTLTDKMGRDFFSRYIELKQGNLSTDQKSVETAMNKTIESAVQSASKPILYTASNLIIQNNFDAKALEAYGNSIGTIFIKNGPKADPTTIMSEALEKEDLALLEKIKPIISSYEKLVRAMLATSVPRPVSKFHLDLINGLNSMLFVSQKLQNVTNDPLESMVALNVYASARDSIKMALLNISNYFNTNDVYFENTEPGIFFATVPQ